MKKIEFATLRPAHADTNPIQPRPPDSPKHQNTMSPESSTLAPAIIAAAISGLVSTGIMLLSTYASRKLHLEKLNAEREQLERKTTADIALSERKFTLDQSLTDWKRRTELAEKVLADFYRARDLLTAARSPASYKGEGSSRPRREDESEKEANYLDAIYAPLERISKNGSFFTELHAQRYRLMALFGAKASKPFDLLWSAHTEIVTATQFLIEEYAGPYANTNRSPETIEALKEFRKKIWWSNGGKDEVSQTINQAVTAAEEIFRPALEVPPGIAPGFTDNLKEAIVDYAGTAKKP